MNTQEIIRAVQNLPFAEQKRVLKALENTVHHQTEPQPMSEAEANRILFERGVIGNIPDAADYTDEDDNFELIEIKGKPLSETVIEERR